MNQWKPISEIPKIYGKSFLIWVEVKHVRPPTTYYHAVGGNFGHGLEYGDKEGRGTPTHYMELPEGPQNISKVFPPNADR